MKPITLSYCQGEYRDGPLTLSTSDPGFVWGATVTDRFRTYRGEPFLLNEHLERFENSARLCAIPLPHSHTEIEGIVHELLDRWRGRWSGRMVELVGILWATPRTFAIEVHRFDPSPYVEMVQRGAHLRTSRVQALPPGCVPRSAKMRSRMHWWIAEREAKQVDPRALAVLVDADGCVTETAVANVLLVREERVISPPRERVLGGVSLQFVRELLAGIDMTIEENSFKISEILPTDEVLLTSTAFGICGVSEWDGRAQVFPGKAVRMLHQVWSQRVGCDIWAEFR